MRVFGLGPTELIIILLIVLVLFGPKQLPKLGKMFGRAMKDLREGMEDKGEDEPQKEITEAKTEAEAEEVKKPEESAV
jgi:sec-independent protein translocase protein TatA